MSSHFTVANLKKISRESLKTWILQGHTNLGSKFLVIDVRDSDYIGGHIIGSIHMESTKFKGLDAHQNMENLLNLMKERDCSSVVFHCMLSQQRGPGSAMKFMRFLNEKNGIDPFVNQLSIYILEGGFGKWQETYGEDFNLTEDYRSDIWKFGY